MRSVAARGRRRYVDRHGRPSALRALLHVVLDGDAIGRIRLVVSLPDPMPSRPVPSSSSSAAGLRGGSDAIREITAVGGDPGQGAFVGYE